MDIVSLGHILNETIIETDGSRQHVLGSPAAYSAVCAASLGAKAGLVSHAGKDMPQRLLASFEDAGVDLRGLNRNSPCTTTSELGYDDRGRRRIIRYLKVAEPITLDCIPQAYLGSKVFYVCGTDFEVQPEVIDKLCTLDGLLAADLGGLGGAGRPVGAESIFRTDRERYRRYVSRFEILKASEDDCMLTTGGDIASVAVFLEEVLSWGPQIILLTRAEKGTDICTRQGRTNVQASAVRNVVDTTGAGDGFGAGFLLMYSQTRDLVKAVRFGSAVSSYLIQGSGGAAAERMPTRQQAERILASGVVSHPADAEGDNRPDAGEH